MDVAIIGAGRVGTTLGSAWKLQGHRILFGVRNPQDSKSSKLVADGFNVGIAEEVTSQADVVTLATPWRATKNAIQSAGDLSGKGGHRLYESFEGQPGRPGCSPEYVRCAADRRMGSRRSGLQGIQSDGNREYGRAGFRVAACCDVCLWR